MKLRFSLRTMMILVTCAAALCWWRDRPRRIANRFVEAVAAGLSEEADELFINPEHRFVLRFMEDDRNKIDAQRQPQSPREWLKGECIVTLKLHDYRGLGAWVDMEARATSQGMEHTNLAESIGMIRYAPDPILREDIRR